MTASLDLATDAPFRYQALADWLAVALKDGRFPPGSRLPSVRELCEAHGASLATVTHALHRLEDAGLIEARPRQGFFARSARSVPEVPRVCAAPEVLDARRERLMALAASQAGYLSLGHLALPDDLLPLAALRKLCQRQLKEQAVLSSGTVAGSDLLREQVARRLNRRGCRVAAEDIVVTHGEGEALQHCLDQLAQPGDRVAVTRPVPLRALELLQARGLAVVELPVLATGAQVVAALDERLKREGSARLAACLVDIATSAAAGTAWDDEACRAIVALCARHELPLIECDLFGELLTHPTAPQPLKAFDTADRVLHCGGMACVTGIGFGLGWVASGRHRLQLRAARAVHGELVPSLTDQVIAEFIGGDEMDRHVRRVRRQLARRLAAWVDAVESAFPQGTRVSHGPLGHQLWVTLRGHVSAAALLARARSQGLNFVPGGVFTTGSDFDHCLRLTCAYALDEERLAAVQRLGRLAEFPARDPAS